MKKSQKSQCAFGSEWFKKNYNGSVNAFLNLILPTHLFSLFGLHLLTAVTTH